MISIRLKRGFELAIALFSADNYSKGDMGP
jgi:hypothetical protein